MKIKFDIFDGSRIDQPQDIDQYKAYFQSLSQGFNFIMVKPNEGLMNELKRINKNLYENQEAGMNFGDLKENYLNKLDDVELRTYMNDVFVEGEWALEDADLNDSDYTLAQLIPIASLYSSQIVFQGCKGMSQVKFLDVRDVIKTTDEYIDAQILVDTSRDNLKRLIQKYPNTTFITQYGMGCTLDNNSTLLCASQKVSALF